MSRIAAAPGTPLPPLPSPLPPDVNRGPDILGAVWTLKSLAIIVVALRIWAKTRPNSMLWWDDASIVTALVSFQYRASPAYAYTSSLFQSLEHSPLP